MVVGKIRSKLIGQFAVFLFLLAGLVLGYYLTRVSHDNRSRANVAEVVCQVDSVESLSACNAKLAAKQANVLEFTRMINCKDTAACAITVAGQANVTIRSKQGVTGGVIRSGNYTKSIITITNSVEVTLRDFILDDDKPRQGCTGYPVPNCKAQLAIVNSEKVTLNRVALLHSKAQAATLSGLKNSSISSSRVENTYLQGIWTDKLQDLTVSDSQFRDTGGSALFLNGEKITISNNTFTHCQWNPPWDIQGGQVNLVGVSTTTLSGNTIQDGAYEGHVTPGIEFGGHQSNTNVAIRGNTIRNNTGPAIVKNETAKIHNVLIEGNTLVGNRNPPFVDHELKYEWTTRNNTCDGSPCSGAPAASPSVKLTLQKASLHKEQTPWVVLLTGTGLATDQKAKIYYNGAQWGNDLRVTYLPNRQIGAIQLPANIGPSNCNATQPCTLTIHVLDGTTISNTISFTLPVP